MQVNAPRRVADKKPKKKAPLKKNILYYQPQIMEDLMVKLVNSPYQKYIQSPVHREKIIHLISTLYIRPIIDKRYERTDYVYLSQKEFLAPMYGEHYYKEVIKALEFASVIEAKKQYAVGSYPKAYKLKEKYIGCPFDAYPLSRQSRISKRIDAHKESQKKNSPFEKKANKWLYAQLEKELQEVTVDLKEAQAFILDKMTRSLKHPSTVEMKRKSAKRKGKWYGIQTPPTEDECLVLLKRCEELTGLSVSLSDELTPKVLKRIVNVFESEMVAVQMIHDGQFKFEVDPTAGRVHTNLTNLSSDLRKFIYLRGEEIKGTDLSNSQPLFLALLLLDRFAGIDYAPEDVKEYVRLCLDGKFYRALMEQDGIPFPTEEELKGMPQAKRDKYARYKKKFKQSVFERIFFGDVPKKEEPYFRSSKAFKERFPTVWGVIIEIKSDVKSFGKDAYAQLAIRLQHKEQDIMILKAAKECLKRNIPILTLHDALYTTEEYIEEVCEVILSQFKSSYGVLPKLSPA